MSKVLDELNRATMKALMAMYAPRPHVDPVEEAVRQYRGQLIVEPEPPDDLLAGGMTLSNNGLWLPDDYITRSTWFLTVPTPRFFSAIQGIGADVAEPEPEPVEEDYEVNLTEPLVGWRSWYIVKLKDDLGRYNGKVVLRSINSSAHWPWLAPIMAQCDPARAMGCKKPPNDHCTCGVYALDDGKEYSTPSDDSCIIGEVYGWGRYVRGDKGWRSQWAYPKSFYLSQHQVELIEPLKAYRVPITIAQPLTIYNPKEDGYHGYWEADSQGNIGASEESSTEED
jgi:hypothetical protein